MVLEAVQERVVVCFGQGLAVQAAIKAVIWLLLALMAITPLLGKAVLEMLLTPLNRMEMAAAGGKGMVAVVQKEAPEKTEL